MGVVDLLLGVADLRGGAWSSCNGCQFLANMKWTSVMFGPCVGGAGMSALYLWLCHWYVVKKGSDEVLKAITQGKPSAHHGPSGRHGCRGSCGWGNS